VNTKNSSKDRMIIIVIIGFLITIIIFIILIPITIVASVKEAILIVFLVSLCVFIITNIMFNSKKLANLRNITEKIYIASMAITLILMFPMFFISIYYLGTVATIIIGLVIICYMGSVLNNSTK
jgi:hypothetical protein